MRRQERFMRDILGMRHRLSAFGAIREAVAGYREFMELAREREDLDLMPSPEVDLVWHCHMQLPDRYLGDSVALAGRLVDHNDGLDGDALEAATVATSEAWHSQSLLATAEPALG